MESQTPLQLHLNLQSGPHLPEGHFSLHRAPVKPESQVHSPLTELISKFDLRILDF